MARACRRRASPARSAARRGSGARRGPRQHAEGRAARGRYCRSGCFAGRTRRWTRPATPFCGEQRRVQPAAQHRHRAGAGAVRDVPRQRRRVRAARLQEPAARGRADRGRRRGGAGGPDPPGEEPRVAAGPRSCSPAGRSTAVSGRTRCCSSTRCRPTRSTAASSWTGNDIRFPEGVHYEDSLFSTKVYCQAETIAVIPNVVYYWRVVADAEEAEASITQRRYEFENFRDRIAVHRMMDDFLREHGSADLKVHKDFKFIRHDLKLYLTDLPDRDEEYQRKFMQLAADYLATVSEETLAMVLPGRAGLRAHDPATRRGGDAEHGRLPPVRLQALDRPGRARRAGVLVRKVPRHPGGPRRHGRHRDGVPSAAVRPARPAQPRHGRPARGARSCTSRAGS